MSKQHAASLVVIALVSFINARMKVSGPCVLAQTSCVMILIIMLAVTTAYTLGPSGRRLETLYHGENDPHGNPGGYLHQAVIEA